MSDPDRHAGPEPAGRRIGLFGGSFNPAHAGHLAVALTALKALKLDAVWWLVSPQNPLKDPRETDDFAERLSAARKLAHHPRFLVTDLEKHLGTRNTAQTLAKLKHRLARGKFVWIMGADSFAGLHHWNRWRDIVKTLPLAVIDRPGHGLKAMSSPAARLLAKHRLNRRSAAKLAGTKPPAWLFLSLPLRKESSTAIRKARQSPASKP
jgi:nicotinate-nucleotide adenylyltransferase